MSRSLARWAQGLRLLRHKPLLPISVVADVFPKDQLREEEWAPGGISRFCPMRIGQVLHDRYQIAAKLGWGGRSTVWRVQDLNSWRWQDNRCVALKVTVLAEHHTVEELARREIGIFKIIADADTCHPGNCHVRQPLDSFELAGPSGKHLCMTFATLRDDLPEFGKCFIGDAIPPEVLAALFRCVVLGLDFLHTECNVVHTDLKPENIMLAFDIQEQLEVLHAHADHERTTPFPQKYFGDRTIYASHGFGPMNEKLIGPPVITDFDVAMLHDPEEPRSHLIQPEGLRAPEVVVGAPWDYSADIWNLGMLLQYLVQGRDVFLDADRNVSLARMAACLGPPPSELLRRSVKATGTVECADVSGVNGVDESLSLESFVTRMEGEEKVAFLSCLRKMLRWLPEERATARELLDDPWLSGGFRSRKATVAT